MYAGDTPVVVTFVSALISFTLIVWFVVFSILVIKKLTKIIELLSKRQ